MSTTTSTAGSSSVLHPTQTTPELERVPISALPLPPPTHSLLHSLTPDPHTPTARAWRETRTARPSLQRRARLLAPDAHFSYVAPCPLPFPFRVEFPPAAVPSGDEDAEAAGEAQVRAVERWLVEREALREVRTVEPPTGGRLEEVGASGGGGKGGGLRRYIAEKRDEERVLVGLSEAGLRDCLPRLDVGDAFEVLGAPSLLAAGEQEEEGVVATHTGSLGGVVADTHGAATEEASISASVAARQELVDVLSGHTMLMNDDGEDATTHWAPWSLRYSGHQFGTWAGQLGDGRAISVLSTPHPEDPETVYELQLKGAGRTPFSRTADGLAVLRSSVREFLCAEAMHALGIPTTRSLSLVSLPKLPVERERTETACVLTRVAPSFVRIGCFEAFNPPAQLYFFGGGQQPAHLDGLRVLGEWVARRVLRLPDIRWRGQEASAGGPGDAWGEGLVLEAARRNARMVAGWQAYGFMHGVINTDNVSVMGLTIDYGPYSFMDVFDPWHICNHSDSEGRYAYKYQPTMIVYALRALLESLAPLIGAEDELGGKAVSPGWADDTPDDKVKEWSARGKELVKAKMESIAEEECAAEYGRLMHKRLGLRRMDKDDESQLARPLLALMEEHKLDFHGTFRRLCFFTPSTAAEGGALQGFVESVLRLTPDAERMDRIKASSDWSGWLRKYAARIESERDRWDATGDVDEQRRDAMKAANPRFVLRQWVLEEVIKKVETDAESGKRILRKVLHMASSPFEPWGGEGHDKDTVELDAEVKEEKRFCSMGEKKMLGFQCSCSS